MRLRLVPLFLCALFLRAQDGSVRILEEQRTFPTYDEGAPDPNPQFDAFYRNVFPNYPYTIRTPINKHRTLMPWRVIVLENEYLSCRILPDLGGHLHGCTDRITGREVFYANPAVRRSGDSVRGEFYASGIETSFPFAHNRVTGSPVDFGWSLNGGVGRVVVSDTDRTTGMTWRVEFILRADSQVLEQRGTVYNGSPARRGYQWWVNAEVERDDPHLRIICPTHWMLPHNTAEMVPWPINRAGVDLSDVANHKTMIGLFSHLSHEPWMALYKPSLRSGVAHYADPNVIPGKKAFLFGDTDTYIQTTLTENFNAFVEMQAGELETQPEFDFLLPEQSRTFEHYWIPFHDLGGVSRATRDAVLNLSRNGHSVTVELHSTHVIKGAHLRLLENGKPVWEGPVDLDPRMKYARTVEGEKLTVDLSSAAGAALLHHVEGEFNAAPYDPKAKNPEPMIPVGDSDEEEASLEQGTYNEQRDQLAFAWGNYERGLKRTPDSLKLATAAGRVAVALNRYDDAIRLLKNVAASNPEAAYYYGVALAITVENVAEAQTALGIAAKDPAYAAAAKLQLALLAAREHEAAGITEALKIVQELAAKPAAPPRLGALEVALLRRAGRTQEAKTRLRFWLAKDPSNDMLRVESGTDDAELWGHLGANPERVLNIAEQYRQMGADDDALKLLDRLYPDSPANEKEPSWVLPQNYPLVAYFRGYLRLKLGQDPKPDFLTASTLSSLYVFPHREIDYRIFAAVLAQNNRDAVAHNLLADLYFDSFKPAEAIAEWRKAIALKRDLPAAHQSLGRALAEYSKEPPKVAQAVLAEGKTVEVGAQQPTPGTLEMTNATSSSALPPEPSAAAAPPAEAQGGTVNIGTATMLVAKVDTASFALVRSVSDANWAMSQFNPTQFPQDKQPENVRRAYVEVQLQKVLALARQKSCPQAMDGLDNLGQMNTTLPFTYSKFSGFMKEAHFQYYMAVAESLCGADKAARKRWTKLSQTTEPADSVEWVFPYLAAKRLGESDVSQRIQTALDEAKKVQLNAATPALAFIQGTLLAAVGKREEGSALLEKSAADSDPFLEYMSLAMLAEAGH